MSRADPADPLPPGFRLLADPGEHVDDFLRLAALASAAHDGFTFRDPEATRRFYRDLYDRGGADFAPPAGRLLLVDGRPAGMFALVPPPILQRRRLVGALVLVRLERARGDAGLSERLRMAAGTLVRPTDADGYLSRIAIDPAMSGRGLGLLLLREALDVTRALGLARCVLDVADTNERAIALYRRAGFDEIGRAATTDPETGARLGYLHMARAV